MPPCSCAQLNRAGASYFRGFAMRGRVRLGISIVALMLASKAALADEEGVFFATLPPVMLERLTRNAKLADVIQHLRAELRRGDIDGDGLNHLDVDTARQVQLAQHRAMLLQY